MGDFFQQFLNRASRGYGQLDKKIFGGLLPGGAATPIGAAYQGVKGPQPTPRERRTAALLDATAGAIAGVQPTVERVVKGAPAPVRKAISGGLNALPFSANLFGRYFTGLGNEGLEVPGSITNQIKGTLKQYDQAQEIKEAKRQAESFGSMLNAIRAGTYQVPLLAKEITPSTKVLNDSLAQLKSDIKRMEKGDIPYRPYISSRNQNPLMSPITSVGNAWFSRVPGGYQSQETYDFKYAGADKYAGPLETLLTPSQSMAVSAATHKDIPGISSGAMDAPITEFTRAIVSKMSPKSFNYTINIR